MKPRLPFAPFGWSAIAKKLTRAWMRSSMSDQPFLPRKVFWLISSMISCLSIGRAVGTYKLKLTSCKKRRKPAKHPSGNRVSIAARNRQALFRFAVTCRCWSPLLSVEKRFFFRFFHPAYVCVSWRERKNRCEKSAKHTVGPVEESFLRQKVSKAFERIKDFFWFQSDLK